MKFIEMLEALGGLGLFIFGMKTMAEGLQRLASGRFRRFLERTAGNRLSAALMGGCLSSLLQSSGAASILIIGFVNAGLLSLYQAVGMLVGTGLGTALAAQVIAFRISFLALPAIFLGVVLRFFSSRRRWVFSGEILLGFGLLFFGLDIMETRLLPLGQSQIFTEIHSALLALPVVNVLIGAFITFLVQSGCVAIGVILAMAGSGFIGFEQATAMTLGEVIGTFAFSAIGSLGGTLTAKRTVFFYGLIAVVSVTLVLLFFPFYLSLVSMISPVGGEGVGTTLIHASTPEAFRTVTARAVANSYTLFSLLIAVTFLPLIGFFARSAGRILPEKTDVDIEPNPRYLDFRVVNTPTLAFLQAENELKRMARVASSMVADTVEQFYGFSARRVSRIKQKENVLDVLQKELSGFLVLLARRSPVAEKTVEVPILLSNVNDLEEIGDNCEIILDCLRRKKEGNVYFSETAMTELKSLAKKASHLMGLAAGSLDTFEMPGTDTVRQLRKELSDAEEGLKKNHLLRLSAGGCTVIAGLLYMDIISAFLKIGDHAAAIIETQRTLQ